MYIKFLFSRIFPVFRYQRLPYLQRPNLTRQLQLLYSHYPEVQPMGNVAQDFSTIEKMWLQTRNINDVKKFLFTRFSGEPNCYPYVLKLVCFAMDIESKAPLLDGYRGNLNGLSFDIVSAFHQWLETNALDKETLSLDLKREVLTIILKSSGKFMQIMLKDIFKLQEHSLELKSMAENFIENEQYEDACNCIIALDLQNDFPVDKLMMPLLDERKISVLIKYVTGNPKLQMELAKNLDELLGTLKSSKQNIGTNNKLLEVRQKTVYKCLSRIIQLFNVPVEHCPNINMIGKNGALNVLMQKGLDERTDRKSWEEMIMNTVANEPKLQLSLLYKLISINDFETALKFAVKYDIPSDNWPPALLKWKLNPGKIGSLQTNCETESSPIDNNEDQEHLSFSLEQSNIKFVETPEDFQNCVDNIKQNHSLVGFDSEWKPQPSQSHLRLSLIQLAVIDKVYILDVLALSDCLQDEDWDNLMTNIFRNPAILKLGCGVIQDVQMLVDNFKGTPGNPVKFSHVLDIGLLYTNVAKLYVKEETDLGFIDIHGTKGLSRICEITLGKPISKEQRFCDWEKRPLTSAQMHYAALDAHSLLLIFKAIKQRAEGRNLNFSAIVNSGINSTTGISRIAIKGNKKFKWVRNDKDFSFIPCSFIKDINVFIYAALSDLGLKIRMYGASVTILDDIVSIEKAAQMVLDTDGIFITQKKTYEKALSQLPETKCFAVVENDDPQLNVARIFQHFNVKMHSSAIYSRCMNCNGDNFAIVPSDDLKVLWSNLFSSDNMLRTSENCNFDIECNDGYVIKGNGTINDKVKVQWENVSLNTFSDATVLRICTQCGNLSSQR